MERDARYAAVAAFALLAIAATVAFVIWYSGRSDRREYVRYEIYFDGSVSGLSRGSPVRYLGVDVGRVVKLSLDRDRPGRVRVITEVDSLAPVSGSTEARLGLLGLTGLLYIDLQENPARNKTTPLAQGQTHPVIPSRKGDIEAFLSRLPDVVTHMAGIAERLEQLLEPRNLEAVSESLANLQVASRDLPRVTHEGARLAEQLANASAEATALATSLRTAVDRGGPQLEATLVGMKDAVTRLSNTSASIERIVAGNEASLSRFAGTGVADLGELVIELRQASDELQALARSLRENPSSLVLERKESGMEIPP